MFSIISEHPINVEMLLANVKDDSVGATVLFLGTVRNHNDDDDAISAIYYEAYISMAEEAMAKIEAEAFKRWNLKKFAAVHRIGNLKIGEVSVAIAASLSTETEVPIWKKEVITGHKGGIWAKGKPLGGGG
jgi:molybdopterin synthase catalytic subunit